MGSSIQNRIFKKGSTTFYTASISFPQKIKEDVFVLYSFVRKADDYLDAVPNNTSGFYNYKNLYLKMLQSKTGDLESDTKTDENLFYD
ncbi:Squalene/phytoene synthase, partial [sediment metagenome]